MPNTAEADRRLVAWLKERTDEQLERIMEAPEDGLTNSHYSIQSYDDGVCRACLEGWAGDYRKDGADEWIGDDGTFILTLYGINSRPPSDDPISSPLPDRRTERWVFRRIKAFTAAEILTRRVNRKKLPPQASADGAGEAYAREAEK